MSKRRGYMFCVFLLFNYTENQLCNLICTKSRRVGCEQKKGVHVLHIFTI